MVTEVKNLNTNVQGHTTYHLQFLVSTACHQKQVIKTESLTGSVQSYVFRHMDQASEVACIFSFPLISFFASLELHRTYLEIIFLFRSIFVLWEGEIHKFNFFSSPLNTVDIYGLVYCYFFQLQRVLTSLSTLISFFLLFLLSKCLKTVTSAVIIFLKAPNKSASL